MSRYRVFSILTVIAIIALAIRMGQRRVVYSQAPPADPAAIAVRVRFGVTDTSPRSWNGAISATNAAIVGMRNWHPRPGDSIQGSASWTLSTRRGPNFQLRPWDADSPTGAVPYVLVPGIIIDVKPQPGGKLSLQTANGSFDVTLASLQPGQTTTALNGAVQVDLVAAGGPLSTTDTQSDFATILAGAARGEVFAAWTAYKSGAADVMLRRFDGASWSASQRVTEKPGDVFLVKLGRDRNNGLWAVWSQQIEGNFDLYARRFDGKAWSKTERLTEDPQPDIYHNLATDSNGNLWLTWQGFRNGKSDIFTRRYDGSAWSAAERISTSPANDWEPAIAADSQGRVYVAWDTYDKGNYDVMIRRYANGAWSDPTPVADTPKYEAHVSLACDRQNRLWAAWNESGFEWGKDTGFLVKHEGTRLYQWRSMGLAVRDGDKWLQPAADLNTSLPRDIRDYNDFPVLQTDASGRPWVFFRHRTLRIRDTPSDTPAHRAAWEIFGTAYDGNRWIMPVAVPQSQARSDVRSGFALDDSGALWAAWPTDYRDFEEFLFNRTEVHAGRVPVPPASGAAPALVAREIPKLTAFAKHASEAEDLRRIRGYTIESGGSTYHIYRGDTHRHTEFSMDGNNDGTLQQTYRYAIDAAELDYLAGSEHNGDGGPDVEYVLYLLQQMADVLMLPKTFTPLYAYERSLPYPNGHRNIIFATRGIPTLPIPDAERQAKVGAKPLYEYLKRYGGIAISHTSATGMGTDWRDNDPDVEPLVEIYQGDRVSAEYEGAPKAANRLYPVSAPGGFRPAGYVWNAWKKGFKLGVQVASDHLSTHISYACTIATEFTRAGLMDAMRKRHSYGATDNIVLDYRLKAPGKEYLQGDIVTAPADFQLSVRVLGTAPVRQIDIIKNDAFIHTRQPMEKDVNFTFVDTQSKPGQSFYYVRVIQVDDQMAWSSPIWVTRQ